MLTEIKQESEEEVFPLTVFFKRQLFSLQPSLETL